MTRTNTFPLITINDRTVTTKAIEMIRGAKSLMAFVDALKALGIKVNSSARRVYVGGLYRQVKEQLRAFAGSVSIDELLGEHKSPCVIHNGPQLGGLAAARNRRDRLQAEASAAEALLEIRREADRAQQRSGCCPNGGPKSNVA